MPEASSIGDRMAIVRSAELPIDHLVAELAAFPVASEGALRCPVIALDPGLRDATAGLWRAAEVDLLRRFPAVSPEELLAIRDQVWFDVGLGHGPRSLASYLGGLARRHLQLRGDVVVPLADRERDRRQEAHGALARRLWRWIELALPPDLLLAGLDPVGGLTAPIERLSPMLDRSLREKGYAEAHMHLGAALRFPDLWVATQHALAETDLDQRAFSAPAGELDEGRELGSWLVVAALARDLLGDRLARASGDLLEGSYVDKVARSFGFAAVTLLESKLRELTLGSLRLEREEHALLRAMLRERTRARPARIPERVDDVAAADPMARFFPPGRGERTPEMRFIAAGLDAYLDVGGDDPAAAARSWEAALFWQVVRVRGVYYRHLVQRPLTPGLQWFVRHFGRLKPAKDRVPPRLLVESAARISGVPAPAPTEPVRPCGMRSLEVRVGPSEDRSWNRQLVDEIETASARIHGRVPDAEQRDRLAWIRPRRWLARDESDVEIGVVFHFSRDRGGGNLEGQPGARGVSSFAEPAPSSILRADPAPSYRFAEFYRRKQREAEALAWLLESFPRTLFLVRGVDVCTDELGVPTWVMAPLIARVRRAGAEASAYLCDLNREDVPTLSTTAHAGEDFVHLLNGLRNIDQAVEHFALGEGDRIGHGIALGLEPLGWARKAGRVAMPREERLFDLVWEWAWYGKEGAPPRRRDVIELEILEHAHALFGSRIRSPYDLVRLQSDLVDPESMFDGVRYPDGEPVPPVDPDRRRRQDLLRRFLSDPKVFRAGRESIWVDPSEEGPALDELQRGLRAKVAARGLAVEVNPTSNMLIGDLADLSTHPLWRLDPLEPSDVPRISVCVGSDDPITFASDVRTELQSLADVVASAPRPEGEGGGRRGHEEALRWVDRVRQTGLDYRFTLRSPESYRLHEAALFRGLPPAPAAGRRGRQARGSSPAGAGPTAW